MTDRYRVIVMREGETKDETLFELSGSAVLVARLVPGALLDVLSADPDAQGAPDEQAQEDAADEAAGRPKRTRRTKAQIAADEAAKAAGFRDAAHQAEVTATSVPAPTPDTGTAGTPTTPSPPYNPFG